MDSLMLWRCMHKMLVVLGAANDSLLLTYPLLHECIRQDPHCNTFFFHCILSLNPHYAYQADTNGDLPLHVAARVAENTKEWQNRLTRIVVSYPKGASIANTQGKLPLELLQDVSWDHMRLLVRCCPVAGAIETAFTRITLCQCDGQVGTEGALQYHLYYFEGNACLV